MKIAQKLTLSFLIFSLAPLLVSGLLVFSSMRFYIRDQVETQLTTFADQREQQLYQVANNKLEELASFANNLNLQILLTQYQVNPNPQDLEKLDALLDQEKQKNRDLNNIYILDPDGLLLATTYPWVLDPDWSTKSFFDESKTKNTATFIKAENQIVPQLILAGPITSQGNLIGVAVVDTDATDILLLTEGATQLGNTAESFLVNRHGPITPLRENVPINPNSLTAMSDKLIDERTRAFHGDSIDYRGESVIAVTRFIDVFNLSLITKIDRNEAYLPILEIFIILSTISLIIIILALVAAYYLGQSISRPILNLATAASMVEKGDLSTRVSYHDEDEFGLLATTFNNMIEAIQKADQVKREFISLASHQLRTPLTIIKWSLELLTDRKSGPLTKKQKDTLTNIEDSNIRMISLVDSLLDVSRVEGNRIKHNPQPVDVKLLIEDVVADHRSLLLRKKINLETHLPDLPKTNLDIQLISAVYRNLLMNSIKYTPANGKITLTVSKEGDHLLSTIKDTGVGIRENDKKRIFKKFFRGKNAVSVDPDGSGLGLFLARTIINSTGGKIWFESKLNKGSTFYFTLPLS